MFTYILYYFMEIVVYTLLKDQYTNTSLMNGEENLS